jgi:acyl-CoA synthetase (AMP-forming)/AMP-acid ligase II
LFCGAGAEALVLDLAELGKDSPAADALARRLPGAGARVAIVAPNAPVLFTALLAAWRAGAVPVPLSARLREYDLGRILADADPALVVSIAEHQGYSFAHFARGTELPWIIVDGSGEVEREDRGQRTEDRDEGLDRDVGAILYTSGTTGEPKGALVTRAALADQAEVLGDVLGLGPDDVTALPVPASHAFGLAVMLAGLVSRGRVALLEPGIALDRIDSSATIVHGSPSLFAGLLRAWPDGLRRLRGGFVAGAACPRELIERLDERGATILNLFGMTELGAAACCRPDDPPEVRYGSVGRPLPRFEFRAEPLARSAAGSVIRRAPEREIGEMSEIQVRGPNVTPGYFRRPELTAEAFDDGWFRTGDLGYLDEGGCVHISGRAKEVANVGGFNVFPAEVEGCLLTHPGVIQAAVVAVPDERMGEALKAFVVPERDLTPAELLRFARERIAGYKLPYAIEIVPELPLLASGKPDRAALHA